jgi:ATP-dependent DNA helicase RecG
MVSDTEYTARDEGNDAIPLALWELERYIEADNPVSTLEIGFLHPEFKKYPQIAIREGIMNAFAHRDYRVPGAVMVKQYSDELTVSSPGELIGGITPENILHHAPVSRNNALANILEKLRLVNRSNLGVPRIYSSMLAEGKEAPIYEVLGENVELTLRGSVVVPSIRILVKQLSEKSVRIEVDELIILNYLLRHREITAQTSAEICQRSVRRISETLNSMDVDNHILTAAGKGKGRYYVLSNEIHKLLAEDVQYSRNEQAEEAALKAQILTLLKKQPLSNQEIRQITGKTAQQVRKLMADMEKDGVILTGKGRGSKYVLNYKI